MLSQEQISQIKNQIIHQIESTFPEDKKLFAKQQIESMDEKQLENFLIQNNMIKTSDKMGAQGISMEQCIFCSIVSGKIASYKIDENKNSIATLEINPISKGHALIIPKEHINSADKIPSQALSLTKKIIRRLKSKLKPRDVLIHSDNIFGHEIINVIPVYKDEKINSERISAKKEELEKIMEILKTKQKSKTAKKAKKIEENIIIPKRIP
ncbi:MAG: HIT domain-containing protein [Nanoarchaeota archaeon]|nr:HIT domain-containing protein [Nanoarchaeota archaeon]